jgi:hypothetical protein
MAARGRNRALTKEFLMVAGSLVEFMWWSLFVIVWVAIAFWPARVAGRKGDSFFLYFLFSLVFFPAALIVAYVVPDRTAMMTA